MAGITPKCAGSQISWLTCTFALQQALALAPRTEQTCKAAGFELFAFCTELLGSACALAIPCCFLCHSNPLFFQEDWLASDRNTTEGFPWGVQGFWPCLDSKSSLAFAPSVAGHREELTAYLASWLLKLPGRLAAKTTTVFTQFPRAAPCIEQVGLPLSSMLV